MKRTPTVINVRVTRPELTEAERERRLYEIGLAAARLVLGSDVKKVTIIKEGSV